MKKLIIIITILTTIGCKSDIYKDENGIIKCREDVPIGFIGEVDGVSYKVVDSTMLYTMVMNNEDLRFICTSKITNMFELFLDSEFNGDISNWDVGSVTNMRRMFSNSEFNGNISNWNVSNVTDMNGMFGNSNFNGDISNWDVSNVTNMGYMFTNTPFNQDISNWDVSNVTNMYRMFFGTTFNQDLSSWNVIKVTDCRIFSSSNPNWSLPKPNFTNCDPS